MNKLANCIPMDDWVGHWFQLLHERGTPSHIRFGRIIKENPAQVEWTFLPHWEVDGIGGLATLFRQNGLNPPLPVLSQKRTSPWFTRLMAMRLYLRFVPTSSARWKERDYSKHTFPEGTETVAYRSFTRAETSNLLARARREGVTVNSLLLWGLGESLRYEVLPESGPHYWMIPVNLRGAVKKKSDTANHSACVWVDTEKTQSPSSIQKQIDSRFEEGFHFGAWLSLNLGRIFGVKSMKRALDNVERAEDRWLGSFSNLGAWNVESDSWIFTPPATEAIPLASGCVTVNGRLTLAIQTHASLCQDQKRVEEWLSRWVSQIQ